VFLKEEKICYKMVYYTTSFAILLILQS